MTLSKEQLIRDLRAMGVETGNHIALGMSFKSLGPVDGGPKAFVNAVMAALGPDGTLLMPTFTIPSHIPSDYVFDHKNTPGYTGLIPETLRQHPESHRSRHPSDSVVAWGRLSKQFIQGHDHTARDYLPYSRLAEAGGKVLSIGIGDRLVSFWHEAQHQAGLRERVPCSHKIKYRTDAGDIRIFVRKLRAGCTKELPRLVAMMRCDGMVTDGKIGNAKAILVPAKESLAYMTRKLEDHPELNLCESIICLWCRRLEWTMDLYDKVENRKVFQRNPFLKRAIASINWIRLQDIPPVVRLQAALYRLLLVIRNRFPDIG